MFSTYAWALYARETKRFRKLWKDTLFNPIVSVGLYLLVFGVLLGKQQIGNVNALTFVYSGLLGMVLVNGAFSNPGFALVIARNMGTISDLQLAPIRPWAIGVAYALAAMTRAVITILLAVLFTAWWVPDLTLAHSFLLVPIVLLNGLLFGFMGVIFGMKARGFESLQIVTTFILQPMIFLAGVFYPISRLPAPWNTISLFNPLHHTINLVRYALLGYQDVNPWISFAVIAGLFAIAGAMMSSVVAKELKR
jgi:ABC-2 type transport system permease protein